MPKSAVKFTFAVIADTHVILDKEADTSPYPVNGLATKRTKWVVEDLNTQNPDFVIHVGDIVRPFPSLPSFREACDLARQTFSELDCPVHFLPGNHDIGDKPIACAPAPTITEEFLEMYEEHFGDHYSSFDKGDCHFVLLNASIMNSGLPQEAIQKAWLVNDLRVASGRRVFVFIHYPPFLAEPDEQSNYDNIDEPCRSELLKILSEHNAEALFAGHVHHFFYNKFEGADFYYLPSTSFARHDFSELFHMEPAAEFGRNDAEKLGYALVDVYEDRHIVRLISSDGRLANGSGNKGEHRRDLPVHPRERLNLPIGVQLRHAWNETRALPHNNPLDEFTRKLARNDYPILATWQTGLTHLRVPIDDLRDVATRRRVEALVGMGQKIMVMNFGYPDPATLKLFSSCQAIVDSIEIILPDVSRDDDGRHLRELRRAYGGKIHLAVLSSSAHSVDGISRSFGHSTQFGFHTEDPGELEEFQSKHNALLELVDGLSFRIDIDDPVWPHLIEIEKLSAQFGKIAVIHLNNFNRSSAVPQFDDQLIANRTILATIGAYAMSRGIIMFDTLMDIDRAHYPRHGLIDRRGNFRLPAIYLRNLLPTLSRDGGNSTIQLGEVLEIGDWLSARFSRDNEAFVLVMCRKPDPSAKWPEVFPELSQHEICVDLSGQASQSQNTPTAASACLLIQTSAAAVTEFDG